ncbi:GGDEF domain-containing protein [Photobacterium carnosum]|uniref:GGDEF domain-containing protein n=1 Tax=Photobacterium carnosum TaxID=2023717 RepID=UPI001E574D3B|nr:GGDEF domain-containing protein [Photobacterium carnosum]MCD9515385.1 diguanylate cyclase [Photobacterium carnosum]
MKKKHKDTNKHPILVLKTFVLLLFVFSSLYLIYNIYHLEKFNQRYIARIQDVYSYTRRFGSYYNNTPEKYKAENHYKTNNVSLIVNTASKVKTLSSGIAKLRSQLNRLTNNNIWTIAVFENPADYAHFDPIRPEYLTQFDKYGENSVMHRIVQREGLDNTYQSFYGCNIKLTESYVETGSHTQIRTLYYPIYNNKHLDALVAIDIKNNILTKCLQHYNANYLTVLNSNKKGNIYNIEELLPCSKLNPINIGINLFSILKMVFLPALILSFLSSYFKTCLIKKKYAIQRDHMTNFYRRDYYEKKLLKQHAFNILIIDIDNFKKINDTYGHEMGDDVIRHIAKRINSCIHKKDIPIRWGGEEFIIYFPEMNHQQLHFKAKKICQSIASTPILSLSITVSIGGVSNTNMHFNDAYKAADKALYHSKNNGRNQYTIA